MSLPIRHAQPPEIRFMGILAQFRERAPSVAAHCERVAAYAHAIGSVLNLPAHMLDLLRSVSLLHDIGKVVIPKSVLEKPNQLTADEWFLIKEHVSYGAHMARIAGLETKGTAAIRHHHERWDGGGYPNGLVGSEIPLLARIVAVADTFDAITSFRPYRDTGSITAAVQEIQRVGGSQLDPQVVAAFLELAEVAGHVDSGWRKRHSVLRNQGGSDREGPRKWGPSRAALLW